MMLINHNDQTKLDIKVNNNNIFSPRPRPASNNYLYKYSPQLVYTKLKSGRSIPATLTDKTVFIGYHRLMTCRHLLES